MLVNHSEDYMTDDLTEWGRQKQRDIFEMWNEHFKEHSIGVQPFTSPLPEDADVICIGYNPGALKSINRPTEETQRFQRGDFSLPDSRDYAQGGAEYDTAENLREYLFRNHLSYLNERSIETNLYHLRGTVSEDHDEIENKVDDRVWEAYENFCVNTFLELVNRVRPEVVVMFARGTYTNNRIRNKVSETEVYEVEGEGATYALTIGDMSGISVIVTPHIGKNRFYYEGSAIREVVETKGPQVLSTHLS